MANDCAFPPGAASIFSGTLRHSTTFGPTAARDPRPARRGLRDALPATVREPQPVNPGPREAPPRSTLRRPGHRVAPSEPAPAPAEPPPPSSPPPVYSPFADDPTLPELPESPPPVSPPEIPTGPHDASLIAILEAPLAEGETARSGYVRKEAELTTVLARLTVAEARALHRRLTIPRPGDALVARLGLLTTERRLRLIHFLADARRREALAMARRDAVAAPRRER